MKLDLKLETITLKEDAKPFATSVPRKVPLPLYRKTKDELDRMLETVVISPVDQPTDWCAPMVVTPKSNGKVRVYVDLSELNEFVKRENHPLPAVDTIRVVSRFLSCRFHPKSRRLFLFHFSNITLRTDLQYRSNIS